MVVSINMTDFLTILLLDLLRCHTAHVYVYVLRKLISMLCTAYSATRPGCGMQFMLQCFCPCAKGLLLAHWS